MRAIIHACTKIGDLPEGNDHTSFNVFVGIPLVYPAIVS